MRRGRLRLVPFEIDVALNRCCVKLAPTDLSDLSPATTETCWFRVGEINLNTASCLRLLFSGAKRVWGGRGYRLLLVCFFVVL